MLALKTSANEGLTKYAEGNRDSETFNTQITVSRKGRREE